MDVLVLSDKFVILIVSTLPRVIDNIDVKSGGMFKTYIEKWKASNGTDWASRTKWFNIRDTYINDAREFERELDAVSAYKINDKAPLSVARELIGINESEILGGPDVEYVNYCYLELADPMIKGQTYVFSALNQEYSFTYDDKTVSRAIKLNQVGYLPDSPKYAYVGCHMYGLGPLTVESKIFEIRRQGTDEVLYSGTIKLRDANSVVPATGNLITGENVYELDFTTFAESGAFYIYVPGVGRSWAFKQDLDVYGEVFYTCARGLFHQRCGIELSKSRTPWTRPKCHTDLIGESEIVAIPPLPLFPVPSNFDRFDIIGATTDMSKPTINTRGGGWHDAADWDRNNGHYTCIFDLLYAYELAPEKFKDGQLNIPESNNTIPDILDEATWGLQIWFTSMDSKGGVSGMVETSTHPKIDADFDYAFAKRTRWDSLLFSAAAAMLAQHIRPFSESKYNMYLKLAQKAYDYGINPANSLGLVTMHARKDRGTGDPYTVEWQDKEFYLTPFKIHAKLRLHKATGNPVYLDELPALLKIAPAPMVWPFTIKDYSPWMYYLLTTPEYEKHRPVDFINKFYLKHINKLLSYVATAPYRCSWPKEQDYYMSWGATAMCNYGRALMIAYYITKDRKYRDAAILNYDFMLGANAMGMSWTTGLGQSYPVNIQSDLSRTDGIDDPIPGITIYGCTGGSYLKLRTMIWEFKGKIFKTPKIPVWRKFSPHPMSNTVQCEYTVQETISATILVSALLIPDGWKPSKTLINKKPKPKSELYGIHYLP